MNIVRYLYRQVFLPLMRAVVRALILPGLIVDDWKAQYRLKRAGDLISVEQFVNADGGTFCIFHLYQPYGVMPYVLRALETLSALGIHVVAVSNTPLPSDELERLKPYLHTFIQRRNFGRDFGGYRRGVLHVLDRHQPDRLILLNDSLYYARRGLREFFIALCGDGAFIGASENHDLRHHLGSYALSFGRKVLTDPRFRRFWDNYRSTELRHRVIWLGEAALSKLLIQTMKVRPRLIYSMQRLAEAMNQADWRQLANSAARMPQHYFGQNPLRELVQQARRPRHDALLATKDALLGNASLTLPLSEAELLTEMSSEYRRELQRDLITFVFRGSQIHSGSLLLVEYLRMPIIKLDLLLRSVYGVGELGHFAPFLDDDEFAEFHALVTARGETMTHGTLKQKLMMMTGLM